LFYRNSRATDLDIEVIVLLNRISRATDLIMKVIVLLNMVDF
jgi:hypothetical protein